jgi:hypothetical protein
MAVDTFRPKRVLPSKDPLGPKGGELKIPAPLVGEGEGGKRRRKISAYQVFF